MSALFLAFGYDFTNSVYFTLQYELKHVNVSVECSVSLQTVDLLENSAVYWHKYTPTSINAAILF